MFIFISEMQPTFGEAKVRISEKKTKFYLSFLEREYLRRSQSTYFLPHHKDFKKKKEFLPGLQNRFRQYIFIVIDVAATYACNYSLLSLMLKPSNVVSKACYTPIGDTGIPP